MRFFLFLEFCACPFLMLRYCFDLGQWHAWKEQEGLIVIGVLCRHVIDSSRS